MPDSMEFYNINGDGQISTRARRWPMISQLITKMGVPCNGIKMHPLAVKDTSYTWG